MIYNISIVTSWNGTLILTNSCGIPVSFIILSMPLVNDYNIWHVQAAVSCVALHYVGGIHRNARDLPNHAYVKYLWLSYLFFYWYISMACTMQCTTYYIGGFISLRWGILWSSNSKWYIHTYIRKDRELKFVTHVSDKNWPDFLYW